MLGACAKHAAQAVRGQFLPAHGHGYIVNYPKPLTRPPCPYVPVGDRMGTGVVGQLREVGGSGLRVSGVGLRMVCLGLGALA